MIQEFETNEQLEMVYLYHLGLPYEVDRSNEHRIKMIFKGDVDFIQAKIKDFWDGNTRVDARKLLSDWKEIKRMMWIGEKFDPNFKENRLKRVDNATK